MPGNINLVELLLSKGADANLKTFFPPMTAIQMATQYPEIVKLLKNYGATAVDFVVLNAASKGDFEVIKEYIDRGGNVNVTYQQETTLLHCAASRGHNDIVQLLIDNGAKINQAGWFINSVTPLHLAAQLGYLEVAELLLNNGANVNAKTRFSGFTPLQLSRNLAMKILLKKYGAKG